MDTPESRDAIEDFIAFIREGKAIAKTAPTSEQVSKAVHQLRQSERGTQALQDFLAMLNNGATGLDTPNWTAMKTLVDCCRATQYDRIVEACPEYNSSRRSQ